MPQPTGPYPTDVCAVVLAAGEGARMRPLTRLRPKVLCPVGDDALVDLALARVRTALGPDGAVAVNVCHGREAVEAHVAGRAHVSVEEGEALGTAGALGLLRPWIDGRGVLVLNGDTWAPGDLAGFVAGWDRSRVRVLVAGEDRLGPDSRTRGRPHALARGVRPGAGADRPVGGVVARPAGRGPGRGRALGRPAGSTAAPRPSTWRPTWRASGGASVVGEGARVEGKVDHSVVWPGARVRPGESVAYGIRADDYVTVLVR